MLDDEIKAIGTKQFPQELTATSLSHSPAATFSQKQLIEAFNRRPSNQESLPSSIVDPTRFVQSPARRQFPPLPDLRFEQTYLASLKGAETWGQIVWITIRNHVCHGPGFLCRDFCC